MPTDMTITTDFMWATTILAVPLDVLLVMALVRAVPRERFVRVKRTVPLLVAALFALLWTWVLWGFPGEMGYKNLFPGAWRWLTPPIMGCAYGLLALAFWRVALLLPGVPVLTFSVLGGLISIPGHLFGIYARGLFEKVPALREVSVLSALVFGFFEFTFYFGAVALMAGALDRATRRRLKAAGTAAGRCHT